MDDAEDSIVEDDLAGVEDEDENIDLKNRLRIHFLSLARQCYCCSSVMMLPIFAVIFEYLPAPFPYTKITGIEVYEQLDQRQQNFLKYQADVLIAATVGYIIGGVLVYLIGRKYSVLAVNLSYLPIIVYFNVQGIKTYTYKLKMSYSALRCAALIAYFIYVAEITSPIYRAFYMGLYEFIKILTENGIIPAHKNNNQLLLSTSIMTVVSSLLAVFTPETPFWLTLKGNPEKAEDTFTWLRAGNSGTTEFYQMLARVENIIEANTIIKHIFTQTFIVGTIFSVFLAFSDCDPCDLMIQVTNDFYFPVNREPTLVEWYDMQAFLSKPLENKPVNSFYGQSIFLLFNFVAPRKVMYVTSYILGVLTAAPVAVKFFSVQTLILVTSYCTLTPYVGVKSLTQILPVEVYPTALREVGTTFTAILVVVWKYIFVTGYTQPNEMFPSVYIYPLTTWISFYASLIGLTFIIIFIPETKNMSIFELKELKFRPFGNRRKGTIDEEEEAMEEADVDEDAEE